MITVYLKRRVSENGFRCVIVYADKKCKRVKAIFREGITPLPNRRRKEITLNCFKYNVIWI